MMKTILVTITVLVSVFFVGCGGGDNTAVIESDSANTTKIVTRDDASKAIGAVQSMHFNVLASALSQSLMTQLGAQAAPNRITYPVPYAKQRECSVSGTVNTTGEKSDLFTYHATNVFDNCTHLDNIVVNGTQTVDATLENNKLVASLSDNNIDVSMGTLSMHLSYPIKLYSNLDFSRVEVILLEEGQVSKNDNDNVVHGMFSDFNVTLDRVNETMYLNGLVFLFVEDYFPYNIQTIVPVTIGSNGAFTSGTLNINGALFKFNNNSTVTVTLINGDIYTMPQGIDVIYELEPDELRFIRDDAKEVVIDKKLQLLWQDDSAAKTVKKPLITQENFDVHNWFDTSGDTAATYCSELTLGGYDDWRMPTSPELGSLLEDYYPYISHVFHNNADLYWTSQNEESIEIVIDFAHIEYAFDTKDRSNNIRCVRDGISEERYRRDNVKEVVIDSLSQLMWQDDSAAKTVRKPLYSQRDYETDEWFNTSGDTATTYCSELTLGGYDDWRLPTINELASIVAADRGDPAIDTVFQNVVSGNYGSSTPYNYNGGAWFVDFYDGLFLYTHENYSNYVRCVRAEVSEERYTRDNVKEVVIDNLLQLMWQDDGAVITVQKPWLTQANYDAQDWFNTSGDTAATYCSELALGEYDDWRLPIEAELVSIAATEKIDWGVDPKVDPIFQNVIPDYYWSSTILIYHNNLAWSVSFYPGYTSMYDKRNDRYVRCVRSGE